MFLSIHLYFIILCGSLKPLVIPTALRDSVRKVEIRVYVWDKRLIKTDKDTAGNHSTIKTKHHVNNQPYAALKKHRKTQKKSIPLPKKIPPAKTVTTGFPRLISHNAKTAEQQKPERHYPSNFYLALSIILTLIGSFLAFFYRLKAIIALLMILCFVTAYYILMLELLF